MEQARFALRRKMASCIMYEFSFHAKSYREFVTETKID